MRFTSTNAAARISVRDRESGTTVDLTDEPAAPTFDDGYRQGWAEREAQAIAELAAIQERLDTVGRQLPAALDRALAELEAQLAEAVTANAFAIAGLILKREAANRSPVAEIVRDSLALVPHWDRAKLRVHPDDAALLTGGRGDGPPSRLTILADPALAPGDVLLECQDGYLDATLESRLSDLRRLVAERLAKEAPRDAASS